MTLRDRISTARDQYVSGYRSLILGKKKKGARAVPEVLIQINGPAEIPRKHLLYRIDFAEKVERENQFSDFNDEAMEMFAPETHGWKKSLRVLLHPIVWNGCEFRFAAAAPPWPTVDGWFEKWFDEDEHRSSDEHGLSGVLHNMTEPKREGRGYTFSIDFGSAPAEAFEELLGALAAAGAGQVEVGSFHLRKNSR